jgi:uncharacterized membrane protein
MRDDDAKQMVRELRDLGDRAAFAPHKYHSAANCIAALIVELHHARTEVERWQYAVGKIAATVPLPDTLKATGTLDDLINYLSKATSAAIRKGEQP